MRYPGRFTQSIQISRNVLNSLSESDVVLLDADGRAFAVLVKVDRYKNMVPKEQADSESWDLLMEQG